MSLVFIFLKTVVCGVDEKAEATSPNGVGVTRDKE